MRGGGGDGQKVKGGQAQGPLVKSVHIPLLSEGIQADPGLLRRKGGRITEISIKRVFKVKILIFSPLRIMQASYYPSYLQTFCCLRIKIGVGLFVINIDFSIRKRHLRVEVCQQIGARNNVPYDFRVSICLKDYP